MFQSIYGCIQNRSAHARPPQSDHHIENRQNRERAKNFTDLPLGSVKRAHFAPERELKLGNAAGLKCSPCLDVKPHVSHWRAEHTHTHTRTHTHTHTYTLFFSYFQRQFLFSECAKWQIRSVYQYGLEWRGQSPVDMLFVLEHGYTSARSAKASW